MSQRAQSVFLSVHGACKHVRVNTHTLGSSVVQ